MGSIRLAAKKDLDAIYELYSTQRYDSNDAPSIAYTKTDWEWYIIRNKAIILVAEEDDNIMGVSFAYDMGIWGYLEHIVVAQEHRGKGHARALIETTIDIGAELGWRIFESCYYEDLDDMKDFFLRVGWQDGGISTRWVYKEVKHSSS